MVSNIKLQCDLIYLLSISIFMNSKRNIGLWLHTGGDRNRYNAPNLTAWPPSYQPYSYKSVSIPGSFLSPAVEEGLQLLRPAAAHQPRVWGQGGGGRRWYGRGRRWYGGWLSAVHRGVAGQQARLVLLGNGSEIKSTIRSGFNQINITHPVLKNMDPNSIFLVTILYAVLDIFTLCLTFLKYTK